MGYDEKLAERIRRTMPPAGDIVERRAFGGVMFLLDGKMLCGIAKGDLMVRVGAEAYEAALARRHVRPMDFTGRPLTGFVFVSPAGTRTERAVAGWVRQAVEFVVALPARKPRPRRRPPRPRLRPPRAGR